MPCAYSFDGLDWTDLPVGPRFDAVIGVDEQNTLLETDGGVQWLDRKFQRDSWELSFKCTYAQLSEFRTLHDLADGQLVPFYLTLDRTADPIIALYGNKEAGFMPQASGEAVSPPLFVYKLKILGVAMAIMTLVPSYALADLPSGRPAGSVARVSDAPGGLWMYSGSQWVKCGIHVNLRDAPYNAAGDGITDDSAALAAAYADLPSYGGSIYLPPGNYVLGSAVAFATANKPVLLVGDPGSATKISYTPSTGTALTFNYGNDLDMGHGMRDITLIGASNSNASKGVVFGGSNGAQGFLMDGCKVRTFGTGVEMGSHTWITTFRQCMIRDCTTLLLLPSGLTEAGEQIDFDHCTFADSVSPHTNAVWVKGNSQEVTFRACSFDQAQLSIGNSTTTGAQVVCSECHFENPNLGTTYDFVTVSNNNANYLRLISCYAFQAKTSSPPSTVMRLLGGKVFISGFGMYTNATMTNFAVLGNAVNLEIFGFNDLSGAISTFLGGSTTGFCVIFAGANTGSIVPLNFSIKAGDPLGGSLIDLQTGGSTSTRVTQLNAYGKIYPGADEGSIQTSAGLLAGPGAPDNANGSDGDIFIRSDGGALTTIYQRRSGSWVGIV